VGVNDVISSAMFIAGAMVLPWSCSADSLRGELSELRGIEAVHSNGIGSSYKHRFAQVKTDESSDQQQNYGADGAESARERDGAEGKVRRLEQQQRDAEMPGGDSRGRRDADETEPDLRYRGAQVYGAIAFSPSNGVWGYSYNYNARGAAERRAMRECRARGSGCRSIVWFRNACGALAVGQGNAYGWGWNTSRQQARRRAMAECRARTSGCRIRADVCSR